MGKDGYHIGLIALGFGWTALYSGVLSWLANVTWLMTVVATALRWRIAALSLSVLSIGLVLDAFAFLGTKVPLDEGGANNGTVIAFGPGYYFWLASFVLLAIAAWMSPGRPVKPVTSPPPTPPPASE